MFSLTQEYGLQFILNCRKPGFHPHPKEPPLYQVGLFMIQNSHLLGNWCSALLPLLKMSRCMEVNQSYCGNQSMTKKWSVTWKVISKLVVLERLRKFGWKVTKFSKIKKISYQKSAPCNHTNSVNWVSSQPLPPLHSIFSTGVFYLIPPPIIHFYLYIQHFLQFSFSLSFTQLAN